MTIEHKKATPIRLRDLGLDEKWLQDRIEEDPGILGLGTEVKLYRREKRQGSGGRIDFVLVDEEAERRYEVEVMLGAVDESHIIRTIEYWDLERLKRQDYSHRAVIVAELITARFYNVIRLLSRSVPVIAIQLNALSIDGAIVLHFAKVLDIFEESKEEPEEGDPVDRAYWEKRGGPASLAVLDNIVAMVQNSIGPPRVTYNKGHIALGTSGRNFCWITPRGAGHCHLRIRTDAESRDERAQKFADTKLYVKPFQQELITIKLTAKEFDENKAPITELFRVCEEQSRSSE